MCFGKVLKTLLLLTKINVLASQEGIENYESGHENLFEDSI